MKIEVCLTPDLIHQIDLTGKISVVIDIFRATSCMVAGLSNGIRSIQPVATVEECTELGKQGLVMAGERGGKKIDSFDIGNSPFEYMQDHLIDKDVATTTTNGTLAISKSSDASEVLIGSFLNLSSTVDYLKSQKKNIVLFCAGWKGTVNLEDTLFAGACLEKMQGITSTTDSALIAKSLYTHHKDDLLSVAKHSSHAERLGQFGVTEDISYCMKQDLHPIVVSLQGRRLVKM